MKQIFVLLMGCYLWVACQGGGGTSQSISQDTLSKPDTLIAEAEPKSVSPPVYVTLEMFWANFQKAVADKDLEKIGRLTQFPLLGFIPCQPIPADDSTENQNTVPTMPEASEEIFKQCYDTVFDVCVLEAMAKTEVADLIKEEENGQALYLFEVKYRFKSKQRDSGGKRTFVFQNQEEGYKLTAAFSTGRTGGDCEVEDEEENKEEEKKEEASQ